jgi:hypothetical protein
MALVVSVGYWSDPHDDLMPQALTKQAFHPILRYFLATICCILDGSAVASMG